MDLNQEYTSKCRVFEKQFETFNERINASLRWIWRHKVCVDPTLQKEYAKYTPKIKEKEQYPNPISDEFEVIIKKYGWRVFRHALVDLAKRKVEDDHFIGINPSKWDKILHKLEQLFKEVE